MSPERTIHLLMDRFSNKFKLCLVIFVEITNTCQMKYISEYRNPEKVRELIEEIKQTVTQPWSIMEVCGGQTHGLVKNGILAMLPDEVTMVHGPGCPVCVTPLHLIDKAIYLAEEKGVILCSYGDMLRVPGSKKSLLQAKAEGADIRILYSPLDAVKIAKENPDREVVFFAVGFETTAPANALSIVHAAKLQIQNYSILVSHVLVPPAIEAVMNDEETAVDAFLAAGHVMTIMGFEDYIPLTTKYKVPIVITGFEPVDLLQGILLTLRQLESGKHELENQYSRVAFEKGNLAAQKTIESVFRVGDQVWRGIGEIPSSGFRLRPEYLAYDAEQKFNINIEKAKESEDCIAGQVLKGIKKPSECPMFGKVCNPENPLGAPMVSSEGACAAYYHYYTEK
jgi:hydrogenase expression/formation protein HypD